MVMNDVEIVQQMLVANPGWWAVIDLPDGGRTSVPIELWCVLGNEEGHYLYTAGVAPTLSPMHPDPIPDHMLVEYRYDPREETMRRYMAAQAQKREERYPEGNTSVVRGQPWP
jgi:hypothetical protein